MTRREKAGEKKKKKKKNVPQTPLRHINHERLHEAQRHIDAVAGEDELKVPERADEALGREALGQLARFDLERDDGVEVVELLGGDFDGEEGAEADKVRHAHARACGRARLQRRRGGGWVGWLASVSVLVLEGGPFRGWGRG